MNVHLKDTEEAELQPTGMDVSRGDKTVGKLDESIFKKWEQDSVTISRSSSDTSSGSEGSICKGGPNKACGETFQDGELAVFCDKCHNWFSPIMSGNSKNGYEGSGET